MRLIAQDKMCDMPYERAVLTIDKKVIFANCGGDTSWLMGIYESHERAKEVVSNLVTKYVKGELSFIFPER